MKLSKIGLLPRLFVAILVGALIGVFAPGWAIRTLNSFGATFGGYIRFMVPFIIVGLVTPAIAETGRGAGKLLLITVGIAYASTLFAGYLAYFSSAAIFPHLLSGTLNEAAAVAKFPAYFKLDIPAPLDVVTALAMSFMLGLGMIVVKSETLFKASRELRDIVELAIRKSVVPLLPFYVLTVIADLAASGKLMAVGGSCVRMMAYAMTLSVVILLVQYTVAGAVSGRDPLKALWTMMPAYLTGWGCCSSAATIPYTLAQTKANGVSSETADLVVPLCANIHLAGSMSNMVVYAVGLMTLAHEPLSFGAFTEYILLISVVAVASPGVPGGMVLACSSLAGAALGFTPERYAIMIAVYLALDGMGTACNLTGDGAIALIVDRFRRRGEVKKT